MAEIQSAVTNAEEALSSIAAAPAPEPEPPRSPAKAQPSADGRRDEAGIWNRLGKAFKE